jgi:tetratricopeptide (TPR) repeat protein
MPPLPPRTPTQRVRDAFANPLARIAIVWVFLIVVFVVIWQVFSSSGPEGRSAAPSDPLRSPWVQLSPVLIFPLLFGLLYWRMRSFAAANKRAVDLMTQGDCAAAAGAFRRLVRAPLAPNGVARFNLGLALLRLGDLRGAVDAFDSAERSRARALRPAVAAMIALCDALAGDLDAADRWVAEARRRSASPTSVTRVHLAAEAIVRLRRGDAAGAAQLLAETWGELERSTAADLVRALRLVRAFAVERSALGEAPEPDELLAGARPFRPGEYGWVAAGWPEMGRYLLEKGFAAAAQVAAG